MSTKRFLTWGEFNDAAVYLAGQLQKVPCAAVYGVPRGGLVLAVALSHLLEKPLVTQPVPGMLWVDDIVDSGKTLKTVRNAGACAAWFTRRPRYDVTVAAMCKGDEWLVFPWEVEAAAAAEQADYERKRA